MVNALIVLKNNDFPTLYVKSYAEFQHIKHMKSKAQLWLLHG